MIDVSLGLFEIDVYFLVKVAILILEFVYFVFAFVLARQIKIMNRTFKNPHGEKFSVISHAHLFVVLSLIILSIFSL